jgi:hypothetical protein
VTKASTVTVTVADILAKNFANLKTIFKTQICQKLLLYSSAIQQRLSGNVIKRFFAMSLLPNKLECLSLAISQGLV